MRPCAAPSPAFFLKGTMALLCVTTIASGSGGNCLLVSGGDTYILIDAGISCRRITQALHALGIAPEQLSAVLITHEHSDHICGLATLAKKCGVPVYASPGTAKALEYRIPFRDGQLHAAPVGEDIQVGELTVRSFPTSHDTAQSTGYTVALDGHRMCLATDLGVVSDEVLQAVRGVDVLVVESNHDVDWLRTGPYPPYLQERILGDRGHLSNESGAELAVCAARSGTHTIILAHLSRENNTPARALEVCRGRLSAAGIDPDRDVLLSVAPVSEPGPTYPAERSGATC